jgi:16S rRNA (guanine966-N2)-methyltransferase
MRIIAGKRRGHKIASPAGRHTRPTSDLVRESIFNILGDLVVDRYVYDVFAGTGALGLEALSRGAAHAVFVERDRASAALIRRNIAELRFEDRSSVLITDAYRWLASFTAIDQKRLLFFLDPPYRDYVTKLKRIAASLGVLVGKLPGGSIVVAEAPEREGRGVLPDFHAWDVRRYGNTLVAIRVVGEPVEGNTTPEALSVANADTTSISLEEKRSG